MTDFINKDIRLIKLPSVFAATPQAWAKLNGISVAEAERQLDAGELPRDSFSGGVLLSGMEPSPSDGEWGNE